MANHMNQNPKTGKKRGTKAALAASFAALLLCGATLVGTTFAWFTDTATTGHNTIKAGELNVVLEKWDEGKKEYVPVEVENGNVPVFNHTDANTANADSSNTLWEPGKTQVEYFRITNAGNLALKYQVWLNTEDADGKQDLYEAMQYQIKPDAELTKDSNGTIQGKVAESELIAQNYKDVSLGNHNVSLLGEDGKQADGHLTAKDQGIDAHYFALAVNMKEGAGNEYMNGQVNFSLSIEATQDTVEYDSFDNQYDRNANYLGLNTETKQYSGSELTIDLVQDYTDPTSGPTTNSNTFLVRTKYTLSDDLNPDGWKHHNSTESYFQIGDDTTPKEPNDYKSYMNQIKTTVSQLSYANHNVDVVISFNKNVESNTFKLFATSDSGRMDGTSKYPYMEDLTTVNFDGTMANKEYRVYQNNWNDLFTKIKSSFMLEISYVDLDHTGLLQSPTMSYQDVAARTLLNGFEFGIIKQDGVTVPEDLEMTAELRLYETNNGEETGSYVVLATDTYKLV